MFDKAVLIKMVGGTPTESSDEGLLIVSVIHQRSQKERGGTVCNIDWHSANLFCQSLGFMFAEWGSSPKNRKYIPE